MAIDPQVAAGLPQKIMEALLQDQQKAEMRNLKATVPTASDPTSSSSSHAAYLAAFPYRFAKEL